MCIEVWFLQNEGPSNQFNHVYHWFEHILLYKHIQMVRTQVLTTYEVLTKYNNLQLYSSLQWKVHRNGYY